MGPTISTAYCSWIFWAQPAASTEQARASALARALPGELLVARNPCLMIACHTRPPARSPSAVWSHRRPGAAARAGGKAGPGGFLVAVGEADAQAEGGHSGARRAGGPGGGPHQGGW